MADSVPELHPDLVPLAPLLGTWAGRGEGEYPTIEPFGYLEEVVFGHTGKPFLTYVQRTRAADDGRPLHTETGFLRAARPGQAEWVLAHATGVTEIQEGSVTAGNGTVDLDLISTSIALTSSAKEVNSVCRTVHVDGDTLTYALRMAAVGEHLQHHLSATLHRKAG